MLGGSAHGKIPSEGLCNAKECGFGVPVELHVYIVNIETAYARAHCQPLWCELSLEIFCFVFISLQPLVYSTHLTQSVNYASNFDKSTRLAYLIGRKRIPSEQDLLIAYK